MEKGRRFIFLLAAGASIDAGLPSATDLTRKLLETVKAEESEEHYRLLIHIYKNLKGNSTTEVDVESLYSAMLSLVNYKESSLRFFTVFNEETKSLLDELTKGSQIIDVKQPYMSALARLLSSEGKDSSYLKPIGIFAHKHSAAVASLNYDLLFESEMFGSQVHLYSGAKEWSRIHQINFPSDCVPFLKLHGSLGWSEGRIGWIDSLSESNDPKVIFGGPSDKLIPEGPFLQLRSHFEARLYQSDTIIVVGYSFRDHHVNTLLSNWMNVLRIRESVGKMIIVDKYVDFDLSLFQRSRERDGDRYFQRVKLVHVAKPAVSGIVLALEAAREDLATETYVGNQQVKDAVEVIR